MDASSDDDAASHILGKSARDNVRTSAQRYAKPTTSRAFYPSDSLVGTSPSTRDGCSVKRLRRVPLLSAAARFGSYPSVLNRHYIDPRYVHTIGSVSDASGETAST